MSKLLLLIALVLLVTAITGCALLPGGEPAGAPTISVPLPTAPQPTATPVPPTATPVPPTATPNPAANPLDALKKVFTGWASVKTFRGKIVRTGGIAPGESSFEMVTPDRIHSVSKTSETIIITNTIYTKKGTTWTKQPLPQGFDLSFASAQKILDQLGTTTEVKFIGPDVLDAAPMLVYQYTFTSKLQTTATQSTNITTVSKVWVGTDGLPHKAENTSSINPGGKTVITYSGYNDPTIVIEPPIK